MKTKTKKEWTVFFLIRAVDSSIKEAKEMIEELKTVRLYNRIAVILCLNIKKSELLTIDPDYSYSKDGMKSGLTTVFYNLKINAKKKEPRNKLERIDEKEDFDIREESHITDFFRTNILSNCEANRYALFTWDHGSPFAIFSGLDPSNHIGLRGSMLPDNSDHKQETKLQLVFNNKSLNNISRFIYFKQHSFIKNEIDSEKSAHYFKNLFAEEEINDKIELPMLTITELKNAIDRAFNGKKLDLLIMMNCFTNSFDTGYELRNSVKYLVAPETIMYFNGYNYNSIFKALGRKDNIHSLKVAKHVVTSFRKKKNYPTCESKREAKENVAFFASSLQSYYIMGKTIDRISHLLIKEIARDFNCIKRARDSFKIISDSHFFHIIDFSTFVKFLRLKMPSGWNGKLLRKYQMLHKSLIVSTYIGKKFRKEKSDYITGPSGFSVYFPQEFGESKDEFRWIFQQDDSKLCSEFVKRFSWDNFINLYFQKLE